MLDLPKGAQVGECLKRQQGNHSAHMEVPMQELHNHFELQHITEGRRGFLTYDLNTGLELHRVECSRIDPVTAIPARMKFFETCLEALTWLAETNTRAWHRCSLCCPIIERAPESSIH
jgi:hypothetical protein